MKALTINGIDIPVLGLAVFITDTQSVTHSNLTPVACYQRIKELTDCTGDSARVVVQAASKLEIDSDDCIAIKTQGVELELSRLA